MNAIKSVGKPVIEELIREREAGEPFKDLADFIDRTSGKEVNKRTVENLSRRVRSTVLELTAVR